MNTIASKGRDLLATNYRKLDMQSSRCPGSPRPHSSPPTPRMHPDCRPFRNSLPKRSTKSMNSESTQQVEVRP